MKCMHVKKASPQIGASVYWWYKWFISAGTSDVNAHKSRPASLPANGSRSQRLGHQPSTSGPEIRQHTTPRRCRVSTQVSLFLIPSWLTGSRLPLLKPRRPNVLPSHIIARLQTPRQVGRRCVGGVAAVSGAPVPLQRRLVQSHAARSLQLVVAPAGQARGPDVVPRLRRQLQLRPPLPGSPFEPVAELGEVESIQLLGEGYRVATWQDTGVVYA